MLTVEMVSSGFGHVINISSIWGKAAPSNRSAYSSAKFAIIGLMDSIRYEVPTFPYGHMITHVPLWSHMITHGHMITHVPMWSHMITHGHMITHVPLWSHMSTHSHMITHVPLWSHMITHGHMITHVPLWSHMITHDHMITHVPLWSHMITHGHMITHVPLWSHDHHMCVLFQMLESNVHVTNVIPGPVVT